jgi:integrase
MAKRVRDSSLESRAARAKLKPGGKPYYKSIDRGLHLGYRKGKRGGRWVVRRYVGASKYVVETIGDADDVADADGVLMLTFWEAQSRARELHKQQITATDSAHRGPYRVQDAIDDYLAYLQGRPSYDDIRVRLAAYAQALLGSKEVSKVTSAELKAWHRHLAKMPARVRSKKGKAPAHRPIDLSDPEATRRRKYSANKVLGQLKAALNLAWHDGKVASDAAWRKVKPFKGVASARVRYLTVAEAQRLVNASTPDFRLLVLAALETGCRYGELGRLVASDFNLDSGTLLIRTSKSGKPRHVVLTDEGQDFFADLTARRAGNELMLGRQWRKSEQARPMRAACEHAKISPPVGFHQLRHTWASLAVMNGTPLPVVARNLGHVDTRMAEMHYGHLAPSYIADEIRRGAPRFGIVEPDNVHRLK